MKDTRLGMFYRALGLSVTEIIIVLVCLCIFLKLCWRALKYTREFLGILVLICLCAIGCGSDEDSGDEDEYRTPVSFVSVSVHPCDGITANGAITVTFDNPPRDVTVSAGTVTVEGKKATITGPFTPGPLALTITWSDGTQALNCTV